jgi:PAS domain S-box-containing protein
MIKTRRVNQSKQPVFKTLTWLLVLAALYYTEGVLLKKSQLPYDRANLFWPQSGLALAAIMILGYRFWPIPVAGSTLLLHVGGVPFGFFMVATVAGNTVGALGVALLMKRVVKIEKALERTRDVTGYLLVAVGFGATFNAAMNAGGLAWDKKISWAELFPTMLVWWVPNILAVLALAPFFNVWAAPSLWRWDFRRAVESLFCVAGLTAGSLVVFAAWFLYGIHSYPLAYLPVPFLLWGTLRFGPRGAATGTLVVLGMAFYFLFQGQGLADDDVDTLRNIGNYTCILAMANLLLAAVVAGRRRAELKLAENEQRLRTVVAGQSELICRFLSEGTITFVNPAFCEFYGRIEEQLLGADFFEKFTPEEAAALRAKLATVPNEWPAWTFDRRALGADDHVEWQEYSIRQFTSANGKGVEYQAVIQNITARKRAEIALQETKDTLEKMNLQLQMSADESRAAAAEANRANQAKSEFLANMSHEIRTPLSGILGMVELLGQTRLDVRQREFTASASESANALLRVINDVLDFSKIEAGKMTFSQEEFCLRHIVDTVLENAATREPEKKINLAAIVSRSVPHQLLGDPLRLRQVLLNLVGNGIKFTERGEVVVRVHPLNRYDRHIRLRFEVSDTGVGLTEEQAKILFQPFVQADTSSSRRFGGTGLGLAISRKIVELMEGRIGVRSTAGAGSIFWFEVAFGVPPQPAVGRGFPGLVFTQALIAVPNASLRESLSERLHSWGVDSREIATADELSRALEHDVQTAVVPLVLCDDEMLALGGATLRRQLGESRDQVQSLLLAGPTTTLEDQGDSLALFSSTLLKPVREQSLFDALVAIVAREKPGQQRPIHSAGETEFIRREPAPVRRTAVSGLRILAAEDHPFNRKLCQLMLDSFGASTEWAVNGREAVEKFISGRYDVILMDCNMPELDGHEAAAAIRQIEAQRDVQQPIRIIALTANALAGEREKCLTAGMDDYLSKPFTSQQLFQSLLSAVPTAAVGDGNFGFEPARLEQLVREIGIDAVAEMVGDFRKELPDRLTQIRRLHVGAQWPELRRAAHSLKGLFLLFGLTPLADRFQAVEEAAILADSGQIATRLLEYDNQAEAATEQLREWMDAQKALPSN